MEDGIAEMYSMSMVAMVEICTHAVDLVGRMVSEGMKMMLAHCNRREDDYL